MMTGRNHCLTCEWNGKPYWSIVSPCASCPHNRLAQTYTSTTTTLTNGSNLTYNFGENTGDVFKTEEQSPEFVKDLPTGEIEVPFTRGDRIRSMSDEEITAWAKEHAIDTICELICGRECTAIATIDKTSKEVCQHIIKEWLNKEWS